MIADALRRDVFRTEQQALAAALAGAHKRFQIGARVVHIDGRQHGTLREIVVEDGVVQLVIATDQNETLRALPGFWSRSSL